MPVGGGGGGGESEDAAVTSARSRATPPPGHLISYQEINSKETAVITKDNVCYD